MIVVYKIIFIAFSGFKMLDKKQRIRSVGLAAKVCKPYRIWDAQRYKRFGCVAEDLNSLLAEGEKIQSF